MYSRLAQQTLRSLLTQFPATTLRRLWTMLAHHQGELLDQSKLAAALGISGQTVGRYIHLLSDLMLVRRLPAWCGNTAKRLVRTPKVYVRDSGLVHALLGFSDLDAVLSHTRGGWQLGGVCDCALLGAYRVERLLTSRRRCAGDSKNIDSARRWALPHA